MLFGLSLRSFGESSFFQCMSLIEWPGFCVERFFVITNVNAYRVLDT